MDLGNMTGAQLAAAARTAEERLLAIAGQLAGPTVRLHGLSADVQAAVGTVRGVRRQLEARAVNAAADRIAALSGVYPELTLEQLEALNGYAARAVRVQGDAQRCPVCGGAFGDYGQCVTVGCDGEPPVQG